MKVISILDDLINNIPWLYWKKKSQRCLAVSPPSVSKKRASYGLSNPTPPSRYRILTHPLDITSLVTPGSSVSPLLYSPRTIYKFKIFAFTLYLLQTNIFSLSPLIL